jgi:methylmalonyl-CoA mutase
MEHLSLLADGREHDRVDERARWEKAAADVLRKSGRMKPEDPDALVWRKLTRTTLDGIEIAPLGTRESLDGVPDPGLPGAAPYTRGRATTSPEQGWDVRAHLADPDAGTAAEAALTDLENGVTSLWLSVGAAGIAVADLPTVLDRVFVDLAPVVLDAPGDPLAAAEAFLALVRDREVAPAPGTSLAVDPVGAVLRGVAGATGPAGAGGPDDEGPDALVGRLGELARAHGTLAVTVDATAVHDAGATDAQELGYSLAVGAACLRSLVRSGLAAAEAAELLEFRYAATDEQFTTIAKFRAARRLWHRVLELSGVPDAAGQRQHAVTSRPMLTRYDPWVNMLRGTVAAFAAGVGGATSVTVLPFDSALGIPDTLGRRNARNTSSLLLHEAHVGRVTDPAGGSFAVERLTDDLARAGWAQLQQIEADGGAWASVQAGEDGLLGRVRHQAVEPRRRQVATRRRPVTGVSEFPDLHETLPVRRPLPEGTPAVARYGEAFERLRDEPAARPVFLATLGPVAQHTARATFAANLLAAGGVDTLAAGATSGVDDVVAAYREAVGGAAAPGDGGVPVVCLAGTDAAYAEWGAPLVAALREAGARHVILAGRPRDGLAVDDSCAVGVDALAFLARVREELSR